MISVNITLVRMRNTRGGSVLSKYDIEQMSEGQREILNAGIKIERTRILAMLANEKSLASDPIVHAILASLIVRINV